MDKACLTGLSHLAPLPLQDLEPLFLVPRTCREEMSRYKLAVLKKQIDGILDSVKRDKAFTEWFRKLILSTANRRRYMIL